MILRDDDLFRRLLLAVARGAHRAGDTLPAPEALAREWTVSPVKVREAYARLVRDGVAESYEEHGVMVLVEGPDLARAFLLEHLSRELAEAVGVLRSAGCDEEQLREAVDDGFARRGGGGEPWNRS